MEFNWKDLVKSVAPLLGTALAGPLGGAALGAVASAILGPDAEPTEAAVEAALRTANPEMLLKLKQADQTFALDMKKLGVDVMKMENEERANARDREIKTGDKTPRNLAFILTAGFFGVFALLIVQPVPDASKEVVFALVGVLTTVYVGAMTYYHGSSAGSAAKDAWNWLKPK